MLSELRSARGELDQDQQVTLDKAPSMRSYPSFFFFFSFLHYVIETYRKGSRTANSVSIKNMSAFFCFAIYFGIRLGEGGLSVPCDATAAQPQPLQSPLCSVCCKLGDQGSLSILLNVPRSSAIYLCLAALSYLFSAHP